MKDISKLESQLNSFSYETRLEAFEELVQGKIQFSPQSENVNMHFHSFYSYNCEGWSPMRIAWEAKKYGLYAAGVIEFDVIDGLEEFQLACEVLGLRSAVGVETRSYFAKFADKEIDSPGEPGVNYVIAAGFANPLKEGTPQAKTLAEFKKRAADRNLALISRINSRVSQIAIDYQKDVLPLTPSGNATERHIVSAYIAKAEKIFPTKNELKKFWSETLETSESDTESLLLKRPVLEEKVRAKFAKKGGFGYVQPGPETFPPVADFYRWAKDCGTIPMEAWLDGTTPGESCAKTYLEATVAEGAQALNIIPDRNWNIKDSEAKALKVKKLAEVVSVARQMGLPINIGTEMNKTGQPFVDDLDVPELAPFKADFIMGAQIVVGHTILARFADYPYSGEAAFSDFGNDIHEKNKFFASVGALPPLTLRRAKKLSQMTKNKALNLIADSARKEKWLK